ncbi:hypothetical protein CVIRNUC_005651 [Coccomyxa viridis]|uniref:Group 1 truncated hemoglobin n=1 Tax=Coccomyxa viridis TaxID=1274662 RepID=A0AAV1I8B5_9CHLO|nr:hypothetical protein CVIRNUC_005651 [Coccomyxa viridis]
MQVSPGAFPTCRVVASRGHQSSRHAATHRARSKVGLRHMAGRVAAAQHAPHGEPLFAQLGGGPAVNAAVDLFYDKMMADDRVNFFFKGVDMKKQRAHQAAFLSYALGGAQKYEGNGNMTAAHQRLVNDMGMRMEHFDIVLEHLGASLEDLNVPSEKIQETAAVVETLRPAFQEAMDKAGV